MSACSAPIATDSIPRSGPSAVSLKRASLTRLCKPHVRYRAELRGSPGMKIRTISMVSFGVIFAALLLHDTGKQIDTGGNSAGSSTPPDLPAVVSHNSAIAASVPDDDQPLIPGSALSLQQMKEYVNASYQASTYDVQCIQNVVRQSDPATRRGEVIEAALQSCRAWGTRAAELSHKFNPDAPRYSDDTERQTIRQVIRDEVDSKVPSPQ